MASFLAPWSSFFVMTGSSAAALTGLMFVVITLVQSEEAQARSSDGIATFSTPTVVHFCIVLLVSALLLAPWHSAIIPAALVALVGLYEVTYIARLTLRVKRFEAYKPDAEDWTWYFVLPLTGYGALTFGAIVLTLVPREGLFVVAGAVLLLIFIGIRDAWDVVTFLAIGGGRRPPSQGGT
ncbi:MAG TPA: hypothetical protein VGX91_13195 [Candidatus Cybelea sp.]|jgi:hypothetical protein|nr:hypothetical protein [Candidatus Cybelea sp.]